MPVDPEVQNLLDAAKAAGGPPLEQQTPDEARRDRAAVVARFKPMPQYVSVTATDRTVPGRNGRAIAVRVFTPPSARRPLPVVVFFHGGGFVTGTLDTHAPYCRALAMEAEAVVVSVDYRLAPEDKFPAAVQDAEDAARWIVDHAEEFGGQSGQVFVAGDSAGGTLATVAALLLPGRFAGQVLLYPVAGYYDPPTASYLECANGYGLTRAGMIWFWDHYLRDKADAEDWRAVPLKAKSLRGLPPALVISAEYDVLRDEAELYAEKMKADGVEVTLIRAEGMNHAFAASISALPYLTKAAEMLGAVGEWIRLAGMRNVGPRQRE